VIACKALPRVHSAFATYAAPHFTLSGIDTNVEEWLTKKYRGLVVCIAREPNEDLQVLIGSILFVSDQSLLKFPNSKRFFIFSIFSIGAGGGDWRRGGGGGGGGGLRGSEDGGNELGGDEHDGGEGVLRTWCCFPTSLDEIEHVKEGQFAWIC
jgi:hypothetical protein